MSDIEQRRARLSPQQKALLQERLRGAGAAAQAANETITRGPDDAPALLSFAQQRQWFLWQLDPHGPAYHLGGGLRFRGRLDAQALRQSLQALVERHPSLRTVFRPGPDGSAEQHVLPAQPLELPCMDLSALAEPQRESRIEDEMRALCEQPFDLGRGPMFRAALFRLAPELHQLAVVMHHISSDAWSTQLIMDELAVLYRARLRGEAPGLAALPIRYADYAAWQRRWLEGEGRGEGARQLAWWKQQLGDAQPVLALAADAPRRADGRYRGERHVVTLPVALLAPLRRQAQAQGATLFMALLAAFHALLHRYTGQTDIRVGVPIANRNRAETTGVVGFFVNTLVMRARLDHRTPLAELLAHTRDAALGAQAHQDLPFERLVEALQPQRSRSTTPLFQVMFNHLRRDRRSLAQWPGLAVERQDIDQQAAQFELALETCEFEDGGVEAKFLYAGELFERATIEALAGHYLALLQALAERPQEAVGEVALMGAPELARLSQWSVNDERHASFQPVHRLFEQQARRRPHAAALVFGDEELSYAELDRRANRLAHRLVALGVKRETRVGVVMERSPGLVVALLAILRAGGAYVPLDPAYPDERLAYMAADSGLGLLLAHGGLGARIAGVGSPAVLDLDALDLDAEPTQAPRVEVHAEQLAYVIYTSGSTGRPKGAANRHGALSNCMAWMQQAYGLGEDETVLHKAAFGFDVSVWEIFWPLTVGARLAVAHPGDHRDPDRLVAAIRRHGVGTINFVPSMLRAFLEHEEAGHCSSLRRVVVGGEALPAEAQALLAERLPQARLHNLYGPTETAIHVMHWTCRADGRSQVPIGRPISAVRAHVLDAGLGRVPAGVAGELYLGGAALGRGYLGRASLTAERFVADPFDSEGARLYRTGDLVRWNGEGQLEYLGRIDHQVKIRGFRIELGEVEAQLLAQPGVREAVVVAREGAGGARLVAYVTAVSGRTLDAAALQAQLGRVLADYMVPGAIMVLEALPLNPNGKLERQALPAPAFGSADYEAPQGAMEENLAQVWAEVLGVPRVGRGDSFFALGGDSILSLKMMARARERGCPLVLRQLFEHQVLARVVQAMVAEREAAPAIVATPASQRAGLSQLSHAQARQWFLWQLDRGSAAYHIAGALKLQGALDVDALRTSFHALVQRHESLRTVFRADAQGLAQPVVAPAPGLDIPLVDLGECEAAKREGRAQQEARRLSQTPFDLGEGPLLRVGLIRLCPDE
ncbi:amino acid adenylation domain-containing protein, partial [Variovorax sp. DT-64]|uniref:amino acid adenylation domain-containing protein n=1 Tax=Variovorax sp. DT-64 TaxID=3396160 RepID=UPI003F1E365A